MVSVCNLPKYTTPHFINTTHSAWNLGLIFDETSPFLTTYQLSKSCSSYSSTSLYPSIPRLSKQPLPVPLPLFTPNLTTATLYLNLTKSQITRLQQLQNSLACAVVIAAKSRHISPILRSLHCLKYLNALSTSFSHKKILRTTQPSYLHNLITVNSVQPPCNTRCSSHCLVHLYQTLYG